MQSSPISYAKDFATALQWPVIVVAAFWAGRSMTRLEARVLKAEKSVSDLITRHMPHIHGALSEIKIQLATIAGRLK